MALIEIHAALIKAGYTDVEANMLLARFLEEETELYVECANSVKKDDSLYS